MKNYFLFTDASLNSKEKIGFGAFLIVPEEELESLPEEYFTGVLRIVKFEESSTSALEIKILLHALTKFKNDFQDENLYQRIKVYTDSQSITGLLARRENLMKLNFRSLSSGEELSNAELYRDFFKIHNELKFEIIKIKGHSKKNEKDIFGKIFSYVDKGSRKALRNFLLKGKN